MDKIGFRHAIRGIFTAVKLERNMKIHFVAMLLVLFTGLWLNVTVIEWLFLLIAIAMVLVAELLNTSIEIITDQIFTERHDVAKQIKDISAGAVLIASIFALIIGIIIFVPRIISLL
ncbi:diacylglycerol kinase family protein [Aquisalibacillus elongatus]|uniref:Undecaprenol kinase/diacylglycerol kinase (ATP) n=1 Tax=Aquisalibacillus elongatus TaxID=485577 RepID=A0A3N5C0L1_9BACI|nr:diacylglycerol kinase family protein [Aquisalibacillus elongatus]RPF55598.1 undecaprenol kinase/diacylglycerol kinase (ATP) [Aquisalibacillus elongatus]